MLTIGSVLEPEDLQRVRDALARARFRDGRETAGSQARKVKANRQADAEDPAIPPLREFVRDALERNELFRLYARPARWSHILFSRYEPGHAYGLHTDDASMACADGGRLRTDLSFTLFLSEPDAYEGGALIIDGNDGERAIKLPAGAMVLYSTGLLHRVEPVQQAGGVEHHGAGLLHRVEPVASGERLAAVGWIQSQVRRQDEREILFDLARVRASLPDSEPRLWLDRATGALSRLWSDV